MKLIDANVLIYAVNPDDAHHEASRTWLDQALSGSETVGFTWIVLLAFIRLTTKVGLFPRPLTVEEAIDIVRAWLAQPAAVMVEPTLRHTDLLAGLLIDVGSGGNLVSHAHLATLATEHHATTVTLDVDFDRFAGVSSRRPT